MSGDQRKGDIVRYWPVGRPGRHSLATVISDGVVEFGGVDTVRVRKLTGKLAGSTDYIAVTHVETVGHSDDGRTCKVQSVKDALEVCELDFVDVVITDNMERIKMEKLMKGLR